MIMRSAPSKKRDWSLTRKGFDLLLDKLDPNRERAAEKYEALRRTLSTYFERHGGLSPEDLADETIDRVAGKLEEGEQIYHLGNYALAVALNVWKEDLRIPERRQTAIDDADLPPPNPPPDPEDDRRIEARLDCLRKCRKELPIEKDRLLYQYYLIEEGSQIARRKEMAASLGIEDNALRLRIYKVKKELAACLKDCLKRMTGETD